MDLDNLSKLKDLLANSDKFDKSDLAKQLLCKFPASNNEECGNSISKIKSETLDKDILNLVNISNNNVSSEDIINLSNSENSIKTNESLLIENQNLKEQLIQIKNENERLKLQLNYNISDSTNANTTVNHINVDIHSQEDLQKFMNFYKEISQGNNISMNYQ